MSKTQQTAGEKPRIGEQEVRRAAELLKKYRQGKVNLERRIIDNGRRWRRRGRGEILATRSPPAVGW